MVHLRCYHPEDADTLLALFRDTIRQVNIRDYTPEQVRAWSSDDIDPAHWRRRFEGRFVLVAEHWERPVGFAELEEDGHIDRFFVSADRQRRGIGKALLEGIVEEAKRRGMGRLFAEASITARPFFEAQGFTVLGSQVVTCRGMEFVNFEWKRDSIDPSGEGGLPVTREPVDSSMLRSIGYDAASSVLEVEFVESGEVYEYFDVPFSVYLELMGEDSKGRYFNDFVKDLYASRRLA